MAAQFKQRWMTGLCAMAVLAAAASAHANPQGGVVVAGSASINSNGNTLNINQQSQQAVIDWREFDIDAGEHTQFQQPNSQALTVNRVNTNRASQINGRLSANGNIVIINQNGVVFGHGAVVDVNGLVATTSDTDNDRVMSGGPLVFDKPGAPDAKIINHGTITAREAGLVGLVAPTVENHGVIRANMGRVHLASGDTATVDFYGDGLLEVAVSGKVNRQLVTNTGLIEANGGKVALTAAAGRDIVNSAINVGGTIRAQTAGGKRGEITIAAAGANGTAKTGSSHVTVTGTLDVSGKNAGQAAGNVTVTGDHITLASGSMVDASGHAGGGHVRIGGDYLGGGNLATARTTVIDSGATIDVSSIHSGDGGRAIIWSDLWTRMDGSIDARAKGASGNGGFVETSGKQWLSLGGSVNASAYNGMAGQWLLDPADITISNGATTAINDPNFIPSATASVVSVASIVAALNNGTNVTITTGGDAFAGNGDITVANAITGVTGIGSLTLSAFRNIIINAAITLNGGNLTLQSMNNVASTSGYVNVAGALTTNGGNITIGGGTVLATGYATGNSGQAAGVRINGVTVNAGGGDITIRGRGHNVGSNNYGVSLTGAGNLITTGAGTISVTGIGGAGTNSNYGIILDGTNTQGISSGNGAITLNGTGGGASATNYGILINGGATAPLIQSTGGAITLTGTHSGTTTYGILATSTTAADFIRAGGNVILQSSGDISLTRSHITYNGSASPNVLIQTDMNSATPTSGAFISTSSNISTNGGYIYIGGGTDPFGNNTGAVGNATNTAGVSLNTSLLNAGGGNIWISGTGYNTAANSNYGIAVLTSSGLSTSGNGTITLLGTGGAGAGTNNDGITIQGGSTIASQDGDITITGVGGAGGTTGVNGVVLSGTNTTNISSTGGAINITGTGGGNSTTSYGIYISGGATVPYIQTTSGAVTLTGYYGTGTPYGVFASSTTAGNFIIAGGDVLIRSNRSISFTSTGITNYGTTSPNVTFQADMNSATPTYGSVLLTTGANISTNGGYIYIGGGTDPFGNNTGAVGHSGVASGVSIVSSALNAGGGNIWIKGTGNAGTSSAFGVSLTGTAQLTTTGAGTITIHGTGGNGTSGNYGVNISGLNTLFLTTQNGTIDITGIGGGTTTTNYGISIAGTSTTPYLQTTTGTITLTGTQSGTTPYGIFSTSTTAGDIIIAGGDVLIRSNRSISFTRSRITYYGSASPNVLFQADMNSVTPTNGGVALLTGSNVTTNGGYIYIGGGTDPFGNNTGAMGNSTDIAGVLVTASTLIHVADLFDI